MSDAPKARRNLDREIAGGALVNAIGTAGKGFLLFLVFVFLLLHLYGPDVGGVYFVAVAIIDTVAALTTSGIKDGVVVYAAPEGDRAEQTDTFYQILANAFVLTTLVALAVIGAGYTIAPSFLESRYSSYPHLVNGIQIMVLALPAMGIAQVVISATKALVMMKWDAILIGFVRPVALLAVVVLGATVEPSLVMLAWAFFASWIAVLVASLCVFVRYFDLRRLLRSLVAFRWSRPLLGFVIPQNLNMTFSTLVTNLDIIMLGALGMASPDLAVYGVGSRIVTSMGQIKMAFSGSYAPIIAQMSAAGDRRGLSESFSTISRWATSILFILGFVLVFFRQEILFLFDESFVEPSTFMLILFVIPLLSSSVGLAGNIVVMSGHSRWNLLNSITAATCNVGLNLLLIPRFGLVGAAVASVISASVISIMQLIEAWNLTGARLQVRALWKIWVSGAIGLSACVGGLAMASDHLGYRVVGCILTLAIYCIAIVGFGLEPNDRAILATWRKRV